MKIQKILEELNKHHADRDVSGFSESSVPGYIEAHKRSGGGFLIPLHEAIKKIKEEKKP